MNVEGSPIFRRRLLNIRARDDTLPVLGPMFKLSAPRFLCAQGQNPYRSDREKTASAGLSMSTFILSSHGLPLRSCAGGNGPPL